MAAKTRLLIVRHGNTFAPGEIVTRVGITDLPLVESGLLQGQRLGVYLQQHHLVPDVIFTSKLKRAIQTAEQIQDVLQTTLPIEMLSIFNEIDYGMDENQPETEVVERIGVNALHAWETEARVPEGWNVDPNEIIKNWQVFAERVIREYAGKTVLVVTSNGIARFSPHLTGDFVGFSQKFSIKLATGALCVFEKVQSEPVWQCVDWNIRPNV